MLLVENQDRHRDQQQADGGNGPPGQWRPLKPWHGSIRCGVDRTWHPGSHWRGVDVIADWCALESGLDSLQLPVLLLAAEHDFVSLRSIEGWQRLAQQRLVVIPGAAHHALLDQPEAYGAGLEGFLQEHEARGTGVCGSA